MLNELQEKLPRRRGSLVLVKWIGGLFSYCAIFIDPLKASSWLMVAVKASDGMAFKTSVTDL
jgi:hypothetical protein